MEDDQITTKKIEPRPAAEGPNTILTQESSLEIESDQVCSGFVHASAG
jgi:hypothetical protein